MTTFTSTDTALLRKIRTPTIKSVGFYWNKIRAYVHSFVSDLTLTTSSTGTLETPVQALTNMSVDTLTAMDCNASVKASDGCIYFLSPWVDTTTTGKSAYTNATSVDLVKYDPITSIITRTNVDVSVVSNNEIKAFSLSISPDKNYIHIFWSGLVGNYNQKFNYKKYDVVAGTLGTVVAVVANLGGSDQYYRMSSITQINGDIYCASIQIGATAGNLVRVYKSINDGTSFSLDKEITISHSSSNADLLQMAINKNGNVVLAYNDTATLPVYTIENNSGIWGAAISANGIGAASLRMVSTSDTDYIFIRSTTTCYAYHLSGGVWNLITSFTVNTWPIEAIATKNNTVLVLYVVGTTYTGMEFSDTHYSTAVTMTGSLSVAGVAVATDSGNDRIYMWVWPNAAPSLWKPYRIDVETMTGTYPLEIKCFNNTTGTMVYSTTDLITAPDFKPFEGTPPMTGITKSGYVEISASGKLHLSNIETEIKQT